jgi:hypothetical protein
MAWLASAADLSRCGACGPDLWSLGTPDWAIPVIDRCGGARKPRAGSDDLGSEQRCEQLVLLDLALATNSCPTRLRSAQSWRMTQEQQEALGWWLVTAMVGGAFVAGLCGGLGALL